MPRGRPGEYSWIKPRHDYCDAFRLRSWWWCRHRRLQNFRWPFLLHLHLFQRSMLHTFDINKLRTNKSQQDASIYFRRCHDAAFIDILQITRCRFDIYIGHSYFYKAIKRWLQMLRRRALVSLIDTNFELWGFSFQGEAPMISSSRLPRQPLHKITRSRLCHYVIFAVAQGIGVYFDIGLSQCLHVQMTY